MIRGSSILAAASMVSLCLAACSSFKESSYGLSAQTERDARIQASADKQPALDTPGVYLDLITRMQAKGLYYASLAHIDAYEKQYGVSPDTILLRAEALRETDQSALSAATYQKLLSTPLAANGHHGLGLLAGARGDFRTAADELAQASALAPTDASTLSDLAYARLRAGDVANARVPLLKAAELDQKNPKIMSNLTLYLLAIGQGDKAHAFMNKQNLTPQTRAAIEADAVRVSAAASYFRTAVVLRPAQGTVQQSVGVPTKLAQQGPLDLPAPVLDRFAAP